MMKLYALLHPKRCLWMLLLFLPSVVLAQESPVTIASPNAASIERFGEIPVNHYTGLPGISVPLYTIEAKGISVPVMLQYHAAGIRPNVYPSWVGLNWSLEAGGQITREVRGAEDEQHDIGDTYPFDPGYYYNTAMLETEIWSGYGVYFDEEGGDLDGIKETEPDIFSFNFLGVSGKFFLGSDKTWKVLCDRNIKVIIDNNDIVPVHQSLIRTYMFSKITLVLDDGTQFVFGERPTEARAPKSIEFTRPPNPATGQGAIATTWNLTRIKLKDGSEVKFEYERENDDLILYTYYSFGLSKLSLSNGGYENNTSSGPIPYSSRIIEPSYLSKIITDDQVVDFSSVKNTTAMPLVMTDEMRQHINLEVDYEAVYSEDINLKGGTSDQNYTLGYNKVDHTWNIGRKLMSISVKRLAGSQAVEFRNFVFSYNEDTGTRLMLDAIHDTGNGCASCTKEFTFQYYSDGVSLPNYNTKRTDHWGYFNNKEISIPADYNNYPNLLADSPELQSFLDSRSPTEDPSVYQQGMLKSITYPTGGSTEFQYEPNDYSSQVVRVPGVTPDGSVAGIGRMAVEGVQGAKTAGGLRIKRIISSSGTGSAVEKEYAYTQGYNMGSQELASSGQLQNLPLYSKSGVWYSSKNGENVGSYREFSISPTLPLNGTEANHIVYSEVSEIVKGNGYVNYKYTVADDLNHMDEVPVDQIGNNYYQPLTSLALERGKLLQKGVYSQDGKLLREERLEYNDDPLRFGFHVRSRSFELRSIGEAPSYHGVSNLIYYYNYYIKSRTEVQYNNGQPAYTQSTTFEYGGPVERLVKRVSTKDSNEKEHTAEYDYAFESSTSETSCAGAYNQLGCMNNLTALRKETKKNDNKVISITQHDYADIGNGLIDKQKTFTSINGNSLEEALSYKYDEKGNVVEVTRPGGLTISYVWSYNYKYPIIKAIGASYAELDNAYSGDLSSLSASASTTNITNAVNEIRASLRGNPEIQLSSYSYDGVFGLTSETDANGQSKHYEYDNWGRLVKVSDHEGNVLQVMDYRYAR